MNLSLLRLLQLADSAIPIGTLAHSFGLETLVADGALSVDSLPELLDDYLEHSLLLEAVFCRAAYRAAGDSSLLQSLNALLSSRKPARETREASLTLGRRFGALVAACTNESHELPLAPCHFSIAFGAACARLAVDEQSCILAFLEQSCAAILSGLVRLMPLGQLSASIILWELKPGIFELCQRSRDLDIREVSCFNPALEIASMRHPLLETRLFVS